MFGRRIAKLLVDPAQTRFRINSPPCLFFENQYFVSLVPVLAASPPPPPPGGGRKYLVVMALMYYTYKQQFGSSRSEHPLDIFGNPCDL